MKIYLFWHFLKREVFIIYFYLFKYDDDDDSILQLPIPPSEMKTSISSSNKSFSTLSGQFNLLNPIPLREISFDFILPSDLSLPFVQQPLASNCIVSSPEVYLNKFRLFKQNLRPFRFIVIRSLPNGQEIFKTNLSVSLESYTVTESFDLNSDFYVSLLLKEFVPLSPKYLTKNPDSSFSVSYKRPSKVPSSSYVVKPGDTLWKIAKTQLNDESLHKKLASINNISDPKKLKVGSVLKLY